MVQKCKKKNVPNLGPSLLKTRRIACTLYCTVIPRVYCAQTEAPRTFRTAKHNCKPRLITSNGSHSNPHAAVQSKIRTPPSNQITTPLSNQITTPTSNKITTPPSNNKSRHHSPIKSRHHCPITSRHHRPIKLPHRCPIKPRHHRPIKSRHHTSTIKS